MSRSEVEAWLSDADRRIERERSCIEEMKETSSCEPWWSAVKLRAEQAKETIDFLEQGKRLVQGIETGEEDRPLTEAERAKCLAQISEALDRGGPFAWKWLMRMTNLS